MEEQKKTCISWIKEHKKELIVAGVSVSAIILAILGLKNQKALEEAWKSLKKLAEKVLEEIYTVEAPLVQDTVSAVEKISVTHVPHDVQLHLRMLPQGQKPSAEKLAQAVELGIELLPGQTFVNPYRTGGAAA